MDGEEKLGKLRINMTNYSVVISPCYILGHELKKETRKILDKYLMKK